MTTYMCVIRHVFDPNKAETQQAMALRGLTEA